MKKIFLFLGFLAVLGTGITGCKKILEENPKSVLTPDYFKTAAGINAGLVAAYSGLRYQYGPEGAMILTCAGTDEFTVGDGANSDHVAINSYSPTLSANNGQFLTPWNNNYTYINTCNGVIDYGQLATDLDVTTKATLLGEAKFLRAHYYFLLLQTFGGVPLDLGSGPLRFNTNPTTTSTRNSVAEVYAAIIQDLKEAIDVLPAAKSTGRATKAAALHMLAKVYLTKATSTAKEGDDYSNALSYAKNVIDNAGSFGLSLMQNFGDVNKQGNEHGTESIFTVEHTGNNQFNEFNASTPVASGLKENRSLYLFTPYYEIQTVPAGGKPVARDLKYQRPWRRFMPTPWLLNTCFADKTNDSRFDNTFRTVWYCNTAGQGLNIGDTAFFMPMHEVTQAERDAVHYKIFTPSDYANTGSNMYPNLTKFDDVQRVALNDPSTRATIVYKLSETYLIAAEAAYYTGNAGGAAGYMNTVRERAAYRTTNSSTQNQAAAQAMDITAGDVNIDFILDERSRELCAEQIRWYDLVRTNKLVERAKLYNAAAAPNIQPYHMLRPIPQQQIDLTTGTPFPQNPGY